MIVAVIILAAALAAAIGGNIAQALWARGLVVARDTARDELVGEQRRGDKLLGERDENVRRVAELETDKHELERRLAAADKARNDATEKEADDAAAKIRNAPTSAAAVDEFNRLLQAQLPVAGEIDTATAGGERDGGAPAVQPTASTRAPTNPLWRPGSK